MIGALASVATYVLVSRNEPAPSKDYVTARAAVEVRSALEVTRARIVGECWTPRTDKTLMHARLVWSVAFDPDGRSRIVSVAPSDARAVALADCARQRADVFRITPPGRSINVGLSLGLPEQTAEDDAPQQRRPPTAPVGGSRPPGSTFATPRSLEPAPSR